CLSEYEKQVLDLYIDGNDYVAIARLLNKQPKSVDNALQRIRSKIRKSC
ncbi:MAG TPA: RNA polymerase subunit sigma-70, partial [Bacteroides sp.]|nr:RNA polymerase subunit sigma-70 [Bacteroides sp.]